MPAKTSNLIQEFLNQTSITNKPLAQTFIERVGMPNYKLFASPTSDAATKSQLLCQTLQEFENNALADNVDVAKTRALIAKINSLVKDLELDIIRPSESGTDKDWIIFAPKVIDANKPLKMHAALVYRFGFVIDTAVKNSNYTVGNLALVCEHSGQDGTERLAAELFLKSKAKFVLLNAVKPHAKPNPGYEPTKSGLQIKYFSDPAHSDTTIFLPMLRSLLQQQFREIPVMILHGMAAPEGLKYQVLIGNCFGKFRVDGWRSFANMLGISFGVEDYYISKEDEAANKPYPVVSMCSSIPNSVQKGDKIIPISPTEKRKLDGALQWPGGTINTNVTGHIGYYAESAFSQLIAKGYKLPSDRMMHVETTTNIRANKAVTSADRTKFVQVVLRAMQMYRYYDPAIHDPHKLRSRFVERSINMKRYIELFQPNLIARYKVNKKDIYDKDTAAYQAQFAKNLQLPPPLKVPVTLGATVAKVQAKESTALIFRPTTLQKSDNNDGLSARRTLRK